MLRVGGSDGQQVAVGGEGLGLGRELLAAQRPFHLLGVTGSGAFDAEQQLRPSLASLACWSSDGTLVTIGTLSDDGVSPDIESNMCAEEVIDGLFNRAAGAAARARCSPPRRPMGNRSFPS